MSFYGQTEDGYDPEPLARTLGVRAKCRVELTGGDLRRLVSDEVAVDAAESVHPKGMLDRLRAGFMRAVNQKIG